jgi:hypothetical protein
MPTVEVSSPQVRSLVVDKLLRGLNESGYYAEGYLDNAILINGKSSNTVPENITNVSENGA